MFDIRSGHPLISRLVFSFLSCFCFTFVFRSLVMYSQCYFCSGCLLFVIFTFYLQPHLGFQCYKGFQNSLSDHWRLGILSFEPRFSCICSYDIVLSFRWWFSFTAIPFLWVPCLHLDFLALFFSLTNIARLFGMITVMFLHFVCPIHPGVCFLYADLKSVVWSPFLGPKFVLLAA